MPGIIPVTDNSRVLRGEHWGRLLQQRLPADRGLRGWMQANLQILKEDQASLVGLLQFDGASCYLKYYQGRTTLQSALYRYRRGRPLRAFDGAAALWNAGVAVPRPLCCLAVPGGAMLLTEGIEGGRDLQAVDPPPGGPFRRPVEPPWWEEDS